MANHEAILNSLKNLKIKNRVQRTLKAEVKNKILNQLADRILKDAGRVLLANATDLRNLAKDALPSFRDRLTLNENRIQAMAESLRQIASLPDPVGEIIEETELKNGLNLKKIRWPLGVILMIFESRPNVILEAFSLAFKSGNSIILRGGSDSRETASIIYTLMNEVLASENLKDVSMYGIQDYDRGLVDVLLKRKDLIDIVVPRGGDKLIEYVQTNSAMPIIKNDRGLCHTFIAEDADLEMAAAIVKNAKTQRPGVCNSLETVLVHENVAEVFLPKLYDLCAEVDLEWHVDPLTLEILKGKKFIKPAEDADWDTEYLDLIINCKIVKNLDEALSHIEKHGSKHSEAIVTADKSEAERFQLEVDAAAVYWNASTRFTDGFEFGLGGELGISTQKLHVRGPVGLRELTTPRWIVSGQGQIRP